MLNKEIATKWVAALRSGEYKQSKSVLRSKDDGYCCLGVLCDLYQKETGKGTWGKEPLKDKHSRTMAFAFDDGTADEPVTDFPDVEVFKWAGIECVPFAGGFRTDFASELAEKNDEGASFEDIANCIEEQLKCEEEEKTNGTV
jgi:hypothetical protein